MKSPILLIFLLFISIQGISQCTDNFEAARIISTNKINAVINSRGGLFHQGQPDSDQSGFAVPYTFGGEEIHSISSAGLWIGGVDPAGNLKVAASSGGWHIGNYDYFSGPLDTTLGTTEDSICNRFNHIWHVSRFDILRFLEDFEDNGQIDQIIPKSILAWPGRGNLESTYDDDRFGQKIDLPDQPLAPFFDRNANGIYEPRLGEHPIIRHDLAGIIPDELSWCVFNDAGNLHSESKGDPIQAEIHLTAWTFSCTDNELLNETIFTRHKIFNRSTETLDSTSIGLLVDADIGCFRDDYLGCDTLLNTAYFYNADNMDGSENGTCGNFSSPIYGENPPVQTVTFLNLPMTSFTYYRNSSMVVPSSATTDPKVASQYYNYLTGSWRDGSLLTIGSDGYNNGTPTSYAFPSNPNDTLGWSMYQSGIPQDLDSRAVMSTGDIRLDPGAVIDLDMAYTFHRKEGSNHLENVNYALDRIPDLQAIYDQGFSSIPCMQSEICDEDCVYPGDTNQDGIVNEVDVLALGIGMGREAEGTKRPNATHTWNAQNAPDWVDTLKNGINYKHIDANGDGLLDQKDLANIDYNYGERYDNNLPQALSPIVEDARINFRLVPRREAYDYEWDNPARRIAFVNLHMDIDSMSEEVYGIAGSLRFPARFFMENENSNSTFINIAEQNSEVGFMEPGLGLTKRFPAKGKIDFALSLTDMQETASGGSIGRLAIIVGNDFYTLNEDGVETFELKLINLRVIDSEENLLPVSSKTAEMMIYNIPIIKIREEEKEPEFPDDGLLETMSIFPNPTSEVINITFPSNFQEQSLILDIYDASGKKCWQVRRSAAQHLKLQLPTTLEDGVYFLKAISQDGKQLSKSFLLRNAE